MDILNILSGLIANTITADQMSEFLHGAIKADFTSWSVKVTLIWWLMRGKVNGIEEKLGLSIDKIRSDFTNHFAKIEKGFSEVVDQMKELKENMAQELGKNSKDVLNLTVRVEKLETKKE